MHIMAEATLSGPNMLGKVMGEVRRAFSVTVVRGPAHLPAGEAGPPGARSPQSTGTPDKVASAMMCIFTVSCRFYQLSPIISEQHCTAPPNLPTTSPKLPTGLPTQPPALTSGDGRQRWAEKVSLAEFRAWDGEEPAANTLVIRDVLLDSDWPGLPLVVP